MILNSTHLPRATPGDEIFDPGQPIIDFAAQEFLVVKVNAVSHWVSRARTVHRRNRLWCRVK